MRTRTHSLICTLLVTLPTASTLRGTEASWEGWRGPGQNATIRNVVPPETWPESLEPVWKTEVGEGYATPLVVGDRIYQHAREGDEEVLLGLDLATGKTLWRSAKSIPFEASMGGERHGRGPKSTPCYAEGRIFTVSITGVVTAWNAADGRQLWEEDFGSHLEKVRPYWGVATSPVVEQGRLYVHLGSCEHGGALFCMEPASGKILWAQKEHTNCYSSPIIAEVAGVRQLVEFNHSGLSGFDLKSGKSLWNFEFPHVGRSQNVPTPVMHDDLFVFGGEDRGVIAATPRLVNGKWTVEEAWRHDEVSMEMSSPVINGGLVYGFSDLRSGQLFCLQPSSGKVLWTGETRAGKNAQFLSIPGHVLALVDHGQLHVLRAAGESTSILRSYRVGEGGTWTAPALVGDALLIKAGNELARWRFPVGGASSQNDGR